jgi:fructose-1,6-bisphosphatase/inositol monophosphatase family enzyme
MSSTISGAQAVKIVSLASELKPNCPNIVHSRKTSTCANSLICSFNWLRRKCVCLRSLLRFPRARAFFAARSCVRPLCVCSLSVCLILDGKGACRRVAVGGGVRLTDHCAALLLPRCAGLLSQFSPPAAPHDPN